MSGIPSAPGTALQITRVIPAPRDRVFTVWTDPAQLEWRGPEGCETIGFIADVHVGGKWKCALRTPGSEMSACGAYRELRPGEKLAYPWQWDDDPDWKDVERLISVEFHDHPEGTELHLRHEGFSNEQSRDNHRDGWTAAHGKLERQMKK